MSTIRFGMLRRHNTNTKLTIILGLSAFIIGLGIFIYSSVINSDTVEVDASYQEENCRTEIKGKYETKNGKRTWVKNEFTLCDYIVSYELDGQLYKEKLTQVSKNSIKPGKRWVNHKRENASKIPSIMGGLLMFFGVLTLIISAVSAIGNQILDDIDSK